MIGLHSNKTKPVTSCSHESERQVSGPTNSKLRDSCHACALAKVKCHKEKPTCSRCARRGTACEYFATRRPGRKRDNNRSASTSSDTITVVRLASHEGQSTLWPPNSTPSATFSENNSYLTPLGLSSTVSPTYGNGSGSRTDSSSSSDIFSGLSIPFEYSLPSALGETSNEFNDLFSSPVDFLDLDTVDNDNPAQAHNDIAKLLIPDDINFNPVSTTSPVNRLGASKPSSPSSNSQTLFTRDTTLSGTSDPSHRCFVRTLDLMKKLCVAESPPCTISNSPVDTTTMVIENQNTNPSAETVVTENKHVIEAVTNMLQCSCAKDGYLLTMLSMIVLKMLERYAAAARKNPHPAASAAVDEDLSIDTAMKHQMQELNNYGSDSECFGRMAAQLILSELHRVQQLINQLSSVLREHGLGAESSSAGCLPKSSRRDFNIPTNLVEESMEVPFSASFLNLEKDLRKSLRILSSDIINMLRQT